MCQIERRRPWRISSDRISEPAIVGVMCDT
jgi:hypothetical protein